MLREQSPYIKNSIKAIIIILFYFFSYSYPTEILRFLGINLNGMDIIYKTTILTIYEASILFIVIYAYKDELKQAISKFKLSYIKEYIKYWILILVLMLISNNIVSMFTTAEVATNQEIIIETLKKAPIYILITTILIAPLLEELIFRFCIKKIIPKPSIIYILVSGLLFGSMHVVLTLEHISDLLFIIPYSIPGIIFAYLYNKTDNILIPASLHFIHNGVLMLLEVILQLV